MSDTEERLRAFQALAQRQSERIDELEEQVEDLAVEARRWLDRAVAAERELEQLRRDNARCAGGVG